MAKKVNKSTYFDQKYESLSPDSSNVVRPFMTEKRKEKKRKEQSERNREGPSLRRPMAGHRKDRVMDKIKNIQWRNIATT